jgi:hypothetical protein
MLREMDDDSRWDEADELYRRGNYQEAISLYDRAI